MSWFNDSDEHRMARLRSEDKKLRLEMKDIEKRSSVEGRPKKFKDGKLVGYGAREKEEGFYDI